MRRTVPASLLARLLSPCLLVLGLSACAESPPPPLPPRATLCDVTPSRVTPWGGEWAMRMSNEGGVCVMTASRNGGQITSTSISQPPAHGEAQSVLLSLNLIRVWYRPTPGFVGADRFLVGMGPLTAWVDVTVVPQGSAPPGSASLDSAPQGTAPGSAQPPLAAGPPNR